MAEVIQAWRRSVKAFIIPFVELMNKMSEKVTTSKLEKQWKRKLREDSRA